MVLVKETENEIDRQIRYFLEEKLEGILEEARKVKKDVKRCFMVKKTKRKKEFRIRKYTRRNATDALGRRSM
ncbi:hypothetical protein LEP1GSC124_3639 [Leptospira interrogans serovar Pyrogenes str. 200701872]|uniref:Uncharacterized protein n=1 Tax=Leptospira interrogans serovar Pyrogenes str. 200701872 TaxID=1193029 RepID=M6ZGF4_LEPIR|nr:hypothetical protein LEP1GSC124_3639 [Leptospira interrogans serovar Pyrogenes str. 200701872]